MSQYMMRIDDNLFEKLKVIANDNSRSINKQLEYIIKHYISKYEQEHGEIKIVTSEDL